MAYGGSSDYNLPTPVTRLIAKRNAHTDNV